MLSKLFIKKSDNLGRSSFIWTVASGIVYSLGSLVFLMVVTNVLGDLAAGVYSVGMFVAQQMLTVGKFSVRNYQVSDVKEKYSFQDYLSFRAFTCTMMMLITFGWVIFGGYRGEDAVVIIAFTVYKMADCLSDVFEGLYQQKFRLDVSGKSLFWKNLIMLLTFTIMIIISKNLALSSVVLAIESIVIIIFIDFPLTKYFGKLELKFKPKIIAQMVMNCSALFISSFLYVYINNSPKYAIEKMGGEAGRIALAHFNMLFMPVFAVELLSNFTMKMWLAKMSVYHAEGNIHGLRKLIREQSGVVAIITIVSMAAMYIGGGWLLTLFYGVDLHGYQLENALLMLSGGLVSIYILYENIVVIYRKQHISIAVNVASAVFAAIIVPICTKADGIRGAVIGYVLANAIRAVGYFAVAEFYIHKSKKIKTLSND